MIFIGLYPQLSLWQTRGQNYQGVYAFNDLDETAYAGYLQALIDGRPRRNNPFTGIDDKPEKPQPESLFSVQFLAPYAAAIPARFFGADASTTLIWISALAALATGLAVYKLTLTLTEDALFAAAATLVVLCCGVLMIGEGAISEILHGWAAYPYFPFLRRYIPAIPFPVFWLFCFAVWRFLTSERIRVRNIYLAFAALCFAALVYSYFYLWTTAAAWMVCLIIVWIIFRPENWRKDARSLLILGLLALIILVPYALMLANRDAAMDNVQLLTRSRAPDLLRRSEIFSLTSLLLICLSGWQKFVVVRNKLTLFTISLAAVPLVVFNQQILTGRLLQPIHYEVFIVNYVSLFAFCLAIFLLWRGTAERLPRIALIALPTIAAFACIWGVVEAVYTTAVINHANVLRDEAMPVNKRLRELAQTALFDENGNRVLVLPLDLLQGDDQPALAPQGVLWARHQHVFAGETWKENRERFYYFLYYSGVDGATLEKNLRDGNVITVISLFGWDRLTGRLSNEARLLTQGEVQAEGENFDNFRNNFDLAQASRRRLSYVIVPTENNFNLANLDRWYERDNGEKIGNYLLYRVKLKE